MNKHTPGPWDVETIGAELYVSARPDIDICKVFRVFRPYPLPNEYKGMTDDQEAEAQSERRLANARLIAAAPDLLEALENILIEAIRGGFTTVIGQARAALAKATEAT